MKYEIFVGVCVGKAYTIEADTEDEAREIAEYKAGEDSLDTFEFGDMTSEVVGRYMS